MDLQGCTARYIDIHLEFIDSFATLNGSHQIAEHIFPDILGDSLQTQGFTNIDEANEELKSTKQQTQHTTKH